MPSTSGNSIDKTSRKPRAGEAVPRLPKPPRDQLQAAFGKTVPDLIRPGLDVLICGINPSLSSAVHQRHFATPGNRLWPALYRGGFTSRQLSPGEPEKLLEAGIGITNLVHRATASAAELEPREYVEGVKQLERTCRRFKPKVVAVLGVGAYREGFGEPKATLGPQPRKIGPSQLYVLPNPSGLNAHYRVERLGELFAELREYVAAL